MTERERLIDNLKMADSLGIKFKLDHRQIKVALAAILWQHDEEDRLIMEGDPMAGDIPRGVIRDPISLACDAIGAYATYAATVKR